jgi:hypothetical protein
MATVHVVLCQVTSKSRAQTGSTMPVPDSVPIGADTMTPTSTSAQATVTPGSAQTGIVWSVTSLDAAVWVNFGADPTAAPDSGWMILAGDSRDFAVTSPNEKCAVRTVA